MSFVQIYFGYQWDTSSSQSNRIKNETSSAVFKKIEKYIKNIKKESSDNIRFSRLRGSAGKSLLETVVKRISEANILIFDITHNNINVWIEVGIACAAQSLTKKPSKIFLLRERTTKEKDYNLPSDIQGYFLSHYVCNENSEVKFQDDNSFLSSLKSEINFCLKQQSNLVRVSENQQHH